MTLSYCTISTVWPKVHGTCVSTRSCGAPGRNDAMVSISDASHISNNVNDIKCTYPKAAQYDHQVSKCVKVSDWIGDTQSVSTSLKEASRIVSILFQPHLLEGRPRRSSHVQTPNSTNRPKAFGKIKRDAGVSRCACTLLIIILLVGF